MAQPFHVIISKPVDPAYDILKPANCIQGRVLPFAKSFGLHADAEGPPRELIESAAAGSQSQFSATETADACWDRGDLNLDADLASMPDIFNIGDGLITLYDAFGQADPMTDGFGEQDFCTAVS